MKLRIGPAGWSYADWRGIVYPRGMKNGLEYIAGFFDAVEINSSFYSIPPPENTLKWAKSVSASEDFRFTVKLWKGFTHDRNASREDYECFRKCLDPLIEYGRLGCLLVQFPHSFHNTGENMDRLAEILGRFREYPLGVEFRHNSWNTGKVTEFLAGRSAAFCNIDQPKVGKTMEITAHVTAPFVYFRFHGRNAARWFEENAESHERYDYCYTGGEIRELAEKIRGAQGKTAKAYVIFNNHFRGQSPVNVLQLKYYLDDEKVAVPESLFGQYPELETIAVNPPRQGKLF